MSVIEKIYHSLPVWLQNIFVSIEGYRLHKLRYGKEGKRILAEIKKNQWMSYEELERFQLGELKELLKHCAKNVPYYQKLFGKINFFPEKLEKIEDMKKIPILEKDLFRTNIKEFLSTNFSKNDLIINHTSGTTGTPLYIYQNITGVKKYWAFIERYRNEANVRIGEKRVTFGGRIISSPGKDNNIFWRYNYFAKQLLFSSYHMSEKNLYHYYEKIKKYKPVFIDGYPSAIYTLAKFMEKKGLGEINPGAILTTAETLQDYQRTTIEKVFKTKVYDQYGSTEMAGLITQCREGSYHINLDFGIVEIINKNLQEIKEGEIGELVLTGFVNYGMPLIRYRIGDLVKKSNKKCICGRNFPLVEYVLGRMDDVIFTKERGYIGRLDPIFKKLSGIVEAQIIQMNIDEIIVKVVPDNNYNRDIENMLISEIKTRIGDSINIKIELIDTIDRTSRGKFRGVISYLNDRN